jgi:hypothetical protein
MCSPVDYFAFAPPLEFHSIGTPARQSKHWPEREYDLLVGGGGLLYQGFRDTLETMLSGARRSIFWGGGSNTHGESFLSYLLELPPRWVPMRGDDNYFCK